ncbi:MAG: hypothetical protein WD557_15675 [Dehalococcoidia bacterium]
MAASAGTPDYRTAIVVASLVVAPLLMSIGDLVHPAESLDAEDQAAIVVEHAQRWYAAHVMLFVGFVLFIPGILALTDVAARRRPRTGMAARLLVLAGSFALAAIFVGEMVLGRYAQDGADVAAVTDLLETMFSGPVAAAVVPAALAFFVGIGLFAVPLIVDGGNVRWPALLFAVGAVLIFAEIVSAEVLLSQIGNILIFAGSAWFAWLIARRALPSLATD